MVAILSGNTHAALYEQLVLSGNCILPHTALRLDGDTAISGFSYERYDRGVEGIKIPALNRFVLIFELCRCFVCSQAHDLCCCCNVKYPLVVGMVCTGIGFDNMLTSLVHLIQFKGVDSV